MEGEAQYFVVEDKVGKVIGFASFGKSRGEEFKADCELYTIYVKEDFIGGGIGYQLLTEVCSQAKKSYQAMGVWVMEGNPFLPFYERNGFEHQGEGFMSIEAVKIKNLMYVKRLR
jgi:GNAT superfamily N-acetyltransferase